MIQDQFFEGERPLYGSSNLQLERVKIYPGESALKESNNIVADDCYFMGKYPFWHNEKTHIKNSLFTVYARAAIWYGKNIRMTHTLVEAPKMFREIDGLYLDNVTFTSAGETFWNCRDLELVNVEARQGDYIFMNSQNISIDGFQLEGNYSFQDARNVEVRNAVIKSRDAFWKTEDVTVYDSVIDGEFMGWHSKNLRLVNCRIGGTQPLCYVENLTLENCEFLDDADLAFEYSHVSATIKGHIQSIKNPLGGFIKVESVGKIIRDEYERNPGDCQIQVGNFTEETDTHPCPIYSECGAK